MCWIGGSSPCHRWLRGRGVRTFALAWSYGANEPGFHMVLEDGEDFSILPDNRRDMFQSTPQGDQQVKLEQASMPLPRRGARLGGVSGCGSEGYR